MYVQFNPCRQRELSGAARLIPMCSFANISQEFRGVDWISKARGVHNASGGAERHLRSRGVRPDGEG